MKPPLKILLILEVLWMFLVAGTMFGIWLGHDPKTFSYASFVEMRQHAIRSMNIKLPLMAAAGILLTLVPAFLARKDPGLAWLLSGAVLLFAAAGAVTRFYNQPVNSIVMTWTISSPPHNWLELRDQWWVWRVLRTVLGIAGQGLLTTAAVFYVKPLSRSIA